jgi:hypothetical protein
VETRLEGIVHADCYDPDGRGKQFLGAAIECSDGKVWVIAYEEQSPFHGFAGRRVVAFGEPYQPEGQYLLGWGGGKQVGHFRVAAVRPAEVTPDLELAEVGPGQKLGGRLERGTSDTGESMLSFVTQEGDTFLVANDPAGAAVGRDVEVWAYSVKLSPSTRRPSGRYLWIICPYSAENVWEWRRRRS